MKKNNPFNKICVPLLLLLCGIGLMPVTTMSQSSRNITASAHAPAIPVIRGLAANPVLRIMVSIPAGGAAQQYKKLQCTLNDITYVEKVEAYLTGASPFSTDSLLAVISPTARTFDIPVTLYMQPGVQCIWLSIVLKKNAPVGNMVELHCQQLTDVNNRLLTVQEDGSVGGRYTGVAIRKAGDNGVDTYRIPGIVQTDRGTLIAVYDIRYKDSRDLPGNIDVGMSRSTDGGTTWEPMQTIMDMGAPQENNGVGDPSILFDPVTKKIFVAALWSKGNRSIAGSKPGLSPDTTGQLVLVSSADDGRTWSAAYTITPQVKEPRWHLFFDGPGAGVAMQDGTLVFPAQYWDEAKLPYATIIYSKDHGNTWQGKIAGPKSNTTESQVVETTRGTLMLNMRDNRGGYRSIATTQDMGGHWTEHATSFNALQDPVCMGSLLKAKVNTGKTVSDVLFFSNPNTSGGRYNISVKASFDLGETWHAANTLLIDERHVYGYSCLTTIDTNTIGMLYEGVKDLYFIKVPVRAILKQTK
ncbi:MAG: exo-alpha-sialidase [Filimonas sp.]|nr:exo-alpha-sialidase [Filimonas sp.]